MPTPGSVVYEASSTRKDVVQRGVCVEMLENWNPHQLRDEMHAWFRGPKAAMRFYREIPRHALQKRIETLESLVEKYVATDECRKEWHAFFKNMRSRCARRKNKDKK